jgi:hypothetical protein
MGPSERMTGLSSIGIVTVSSPAKLLSEKNSIVKMAGRVIRIFSFVVSREIIIGFILE